MLSLSNKLSLSTAKVSSGFNISNASGLVTWFKFNTNISTADDDSDGDADISWTSSHTDGRVAKQTTDAQEPGTTAGYISFDGSDDNLDLNTQVTLGEFTMFLALDLDAFTNETIIGKNNDSNMFIRFGFQSDTSKFRFRRTSATYNQDGTMSESMTSGAVNLMAIRCFNNGSGTTLQVRRATKSGSTITTNQVYENTNSSLDYAQTLALNTIGVQSASSAPMDGKLYEWVVFNEKVSDADIALIEADILNRIG